ncbi:MAG: EscU/YscU/HrcU family type III secretion system export apparatus switch protein, partial [Paracoccaceae bacterium]
GAGVSCRPTIQILPDLTIAVDVNVAKGVDEIARAIRDLATDSGVPIHSDPPTARAIYASVEIGQEVGADLYGPVAVAIRFARDARAKSKTRGW